jgi:hypothetical protein
MYSEHEPFIREAIESARAALRRGDGPYGAVLVADGRVLLRAENTTHTDADVTRHAEMNLVVQAQRQLAPRDLQLPHCGSRASLGRTTMNSAHEFRLTDPSRTDRPWHPWPRPARLHVTHVQEDAHVSVSPAALLAG